MVNVAIIGHGVVGSGVAEIMTEHADRLSEKIMDEIQLKYILDIKEFKGLPYSNLFIKDFDTIINDDTVSIVVEVMGGLHPAYDFVKASLEAGKSVVTSNKELVAEKGYELIKIAKEKNVNFLFEASVGGTIPIIRPLSQCLAANEIDDVYGILNGTTNYILNKMIVENMDFDTALALAQENGFAERNPAADIEGHDACRKICIIASLVFGKHVYPSQVETKGITEITLNDIENASKFDCVIKLIARAKKEKNGKISVSVAPTLLDKDMLISRVDGVFNAINVHGDACGDVLFSGKGAGKMPTASAVVADVLDCAKHFKARKYMFWNEGSDDYVIESPEPTRLYVSAINENFSELKESFDSLFSGNTWYNENEYLNEIAFITEKDSRSNLIKKIEKLKAQNYKIMNTLF